MKNVHKIMFVVVFGTLLTYSCGNKATDASDGSIRGPILTNSKNSGAFITMVASDQAISTNALYYYDFGTGAISQVATSDGRDPVALWDATTKSVSYIVRSTKSFRIIKLENGSPTDAKSGTLNDLQAGDPTAWSSTESGSFLFANIHDRSIRSFEASSGYLSSAADVSAVDVSSTGTAFTPVSVARIASKAWAASSGVDFSGTVPTAKGPAGLVTLTKATGADSWTASSQVAGTLTASYPVYAAQTADGTALRFFGLCKSSFGASCRAGADEVVAASGVRTSLSMISSSSYEYFAGTVAGANDDLVYAHVTKTATQENIVVQINLKTGSFTEIYTFQSAGLGLLAYDKNADRLLVGDKENSLGVLKVFKANELEASVVTRDIPWQGSFVESL